MSRLLVAFVLMFMSTVASAAITGRVPPLRPPAGSVCGKLAMPSLGNMGYCLTPGSKTRTLVFFPGIMNNEDAWNGEAPQHLVKSFKTQGAESPTVLTVSMGRIFFLTGRKLENGMTDVEEVTQTLIKLVRRLGLSNFEGASHLDLMGDSMGGNNSLHVFIRAPELFNRFAMICPANSRVSPFAPLSVWEKNLKEEGANYLYSIALRQTLEFFYKNETNWDLQSPLRYIAAGNYHALSKPQPIFIGIVKHDPYGFNHVERDLAGLLLRNGHSVTFTVSDAGHCYIDTDPLAAFFLR